MKEAAISLKLPTSIRQAAERLAEDDGVSLNNWISSAVAQKVGSVESAAEFFASRAAKAPGTGIMPFLTEAPDVPDDSQQA